MKLAIVGTRKPGITFADLEQLLLAKVTLKDVTLIVSGGAKGIVTYAKLFAGRHHIPFMEFQPDYATFGRNATLRRNTQIVCEANMVVAFPSPDSRGTLHSISEAKRLGKQLFIISIPSEAA